ncbi:MAG: N-acetyl-gamma-glutamyl-phosphate reductase [Proteobacteria bacterium]|nr:N-acetyl-gamma-glutamyl-phosphate reductase [Pseudomonadota bacterium]
MIRAAVIGAAGYTGGELLRLLLTHPHVELLAAVSSSHHGQSLAIAHPDLLNWRHLHFVRTLNLETLDLVFLAGAHGESSKLIEHYGLNKFSGHIIDMSQDFRQAAPHHDFVYGLPELNKTRIAKSLHIANPGCFASAIQLACLPLARAGFLQDDLHITGITGSTGAGQKLQDTLHFSWRHDNLSVYKAFTHQHLAEIQQSIRLLQADFAGQTLFVPMRGSFTRGILVSVHTRCQAGIEELHAAFDQFYEDAPFVHRLADEVSLKQVLNTNNAVLSVNKQGDFAHIVCCLDNLLKGASGQALQNMNLAFGLPETSGLLLKPSAY